jgi:DNA-directed RNA polymerase specialized sigma subunit
MTRLPYGTFKDLSPEEKRKHRNYLHRKWARKNSEYLNAKNKRYFDMWRKTKPFTVQCKYCGADFNAPRRTTKMCPNCHQKAHDHIMAIKSARVERMIARQDLEQKVLELANTGVLQKEIADKLNISQRVVSYICVKRGCRRNKYIPRK